jgi:starch synthase
MYSQLYGTVPLVSRVGGLIDTVVDVDEQPEKGTGITFLPSAAGFFDGLVRALRLFVDKSRMASTQQLGMKKDFYWGKAAMVYERLYIDSLETTVFDENYMRLPTTSCRSMSIAS